MQSKLLGDEKVLVDIKKSYGGFIVVNPDSGFYPNKKEERVKDWSKEKVDSYDFVGTAECEFAKLVIDDYRVDGINWLESKYPDSKGFFFLDGVKICWNLKANWVGDMYHLEINSHLEDNKHIAEYKFDWGTGDNSSGRVPNIVTETGYKSIFCDNLDAYDSMEKYLKDLMEHEINTDSMGKPKKKKVEYILTFEDDGYKPRKQLTLIELQGGEK